MFRIVTLFALALFVSCQTKDNSYYISDGIIHTDKACNKIKGGVIPVVLDDLRTHLSYCGKCMNREEMDACKKVIEYNINKEKREKLLGRIFNRVRRTYPEMKDLSDSELIEQFFKHEEYLGKLYDKIRSKELKMGYFDVKDLPFDELMNLDRSHFIFRMKRWLTKEITGYDEKYEAMLDDVLTELDKE